MKHYRWVIWSTFLIAWTVALTFPVPPSLVQATDEFVPGRRWAVMKTLHVTCYALLAILSGWLRVSPRYRPILVFALMAHCTITELIQLAFAHREGSVVDVAFDNLGILIGVLASWRWWFEAQR